MSQAPSSMVTIICASSCRAHHRLFTKGDIFSRYCNIAKTQGGSINSHPPLYHGGCVTLLCTSEGSLQDLKVWLKSQGLRLKAKVLFAHTCSNVQYSWNWTLNFPSQVHPMQTCRHIQTSHQSYVPFLMTFHACLMPLKATQQHCLHGTVTEALAGIAQCF